MQNLMTIDEINTCSPTFLSKAKSGYVCPVCENGTGASGTGLELHTNSKGKGKWHCFKCGLDTDTTDLIKIAFNLDNMAQIQAKAQELKSGGVLVPGSIKTSQKAQKGAIKGSARVDYVLECSELANNMTDKDYAYLESRGISKETQQKYMVGYNARATHKYVEGIRIPDLSIDERGKLHAYSYFERSFRGKITYNSLGENDLFNLRLLNELTTENCIFICESPIDALSIIEVGFEAVAIKGATSASRLTRAIEENNIKGKTFICALDTDTTGQEATIKLSEMIRDSKNFAINIHDYVTFSKKDCNDELVADRENFKRMLEKCAKTVDELVNEELFGAYDVKGLEHEFLNPEERIPSVELKTGFSNLDKTLGGGLHEGLYILGARSSLGKTTLCLNLAHNIIVNNSNADVIFISLEQSKRELISKLISRQMFQTDKTNALTTMDILNTKSYLKLNDSQKRAYQACSKSLFNKISGRLFIYNELDNARIGADEIRTIVERHKTRFNRDVIAIVDYSQILKPFKDNVTDKQNMDNTVFQLKGISRDFNIPVLAISSFNRDGTKKEAEMTSFKESGAIEYGSDVLLGLSLTNQANMTQEEQDKALNEIEREVTLKVLKNRNGRVHTKIDFIFNAEYNDYKQVADISTFNNKKLNAWYRQE